MFTGIDKLADGTASVGVVFNPLSGRNHNFGSELKDGLTSIPRLTFREVAHLEDTEEAVAGLVREGIDLLVIAGGDGMVQAVLQCLIVNLDPHDWPLLTIIPGGTTNMTALDLGIGGRPRQVLKRLQRLLTGPCTPILVSRPALCIEYGGGNMICGMFFGTGLIARAVKYSRGDIKALGITGSLFSLMVAARGIAGLLFGRSGATSWMPVRMAVKGSCEDESGERTYLLVFASTLERLVFGMRPWWGREQAPIHVTLIEAGHRHFLWKLPWLLRGKDPRLDSRYGCHSYNTHAVEFDMDDEYIVDGELYRAEGKASVLRVSATPPITFVKP